MRRKLITLALAGALTFGGASMALADPGNNNGKGPDANGPAKKGLCTAYFNGQKNGHGKNGNNPPPFSNLEAAAEAQEQTVLAFCGGVDAIGGNPSNGRFAECFDEDPATDNDQCPND